MLSTPDQPIIWRLYNIYGIQRCGHSYLTTVFASLRKMSISKIYISKHTCRVCDVCAFMTRKRVLCVTALKIRLQQSRFSTRPLDVAELYLHDSAFCELQFRILNKYMNHVLDKWCSHSIDTSTKYKAMCLSMRTSYQVYLLNRWRLLSFAWLITLGNAGSPLCWSYYRGFLVASLICL